MVGAGRVEHVHDMPAHQGMLAGCLTDAACGASKRIRQILRPRESESIRYCTTSLGVGSRWEFGVPEEPQHNRFLRRCQLPDIFHPMEGGSMATASRSKQSADGGQDRFFIGPFLEHRNAMNYGSCCFACTWPSAVVRSCQMLQSAEVLRPFQNPRIPGYRRISFGA